jgi:ubiquinone biosynthesis protein COQ4
LKPTSQLERLAADMEVLCADPSNLHSALDLLNASYGTPAAAAARSRLQADPAIAPLIAERYWGPWPDLADQGLDPLPPPLLTKDADAEATYLQRRIRHTHDVWHAIAGCPTTLAGEAAMNGLTTEQLRWPGSALLIAADLIHRVHDDLDSEGPTGVDVGRAIAYGLELGASTSAPLLAQRWEEGWERPLEDWREQLGVRELVGRNPFAAEPSLRG